jgi:hypothetical protein
MVLPWFRRLTTGLSHWRPRVRSQVSPRETLRPTHWHWNKTCSEDFGLTTKAPYRSSSTKKARSLETFFRTSQWLNVSPTPPLAWILPLPPLTEIPNVPHVYPVRATKWLIHFTTYWSLCSYVYCGPASPSYSRPLTWFLYQLDSLVWCSGEHQRQWTLTSVPVITVILFWFWRKIFRHPLL